MFVESTLTEDRLRMAREAHFGNKPSPAPASIPGKPKTSKHEAIPFYQWPDWALTVSEWREGLDKGVGDTIHRKLGSIGKAFTQMMKALKIPCGCDRRRGEFNAKYPYSLLANESKET